MGRWWPCLWQGIGDSWSFNSLPTWANFVILWLAVKFIVKWQRIPPSIFTDVKILPLPLLRSDHKGCIFAKQSSKQEILETLGGCIMSLFWIFLHISLIVLKTGYNSKLNLIIIYNVYSHVLKDNVVNLLLSCWKQETCSL